MKESYENYKGLYKFIEESIDKNMQHLYGQELELTNDMIMMMPNKIDKINYGMMSPLEWLSIKINLWINIIMHLMK